MFRVPVTNKAQLKHLSHAVWCVLSMMTLLCLPTGTAAADELLGTIDGWDIRTWIGESGTVEGCSAEAMQPNDIYLTYYYGPAFGHEIYFFNSTWSLQEGQSYPVQIAIDQFDTWDANLTAVSSRSVYVQLNDTFVEEFRQGRMMRVFARNETLEFPLSGTSRAVESTIDCARIRTAQRPDPFSAAPNTNQGSENPFGGANAPDVTGKGSFSLGDGSEKSLDASQQAALVDQMFNISAEDTLPMMVDIVLTHRDFVGVQRVEPQDRPELLDEGYAYMWTDGAGVFGGATVSESDAESRVQELIQHDDSACSNGGISVERDAVELSPLGGTLHELTIICQESAGVWNANYSVIPFRDHSITFAHASRDLHRSETYNHGVIDAIVTWIYLLAEPGATPNDHN